MSTNDTVNSASDNDNTVSADKAKPKSAETLKVTVGRDWGELTLHEEIVRFEVAAQQRLIARFGLFLALILSGLILHSMIIGDEAALRTYSNVIQVSFSGCLGWALGHKTK